MIAWIAKHVRGNSFIDLPLCTQFQHEYCQNSNVLFGRGHFHQHDVKIDTEKPEVFKSIHAHQNHEKLSILILVPESLSPDILPLLTFSIIQCIQMFYFIVR